MQLSFLFTLPIKNDSEVQSFVKPLDIENIFQDVYKHYRRTFFTSTLKTVQIQFKIYKTFRNSLEFKNGAATVLISKICENQPAVFFESLAHVLWSKIFKKKCSSSWLNIYKKFESELSTRLPKHTVKKRSNGSAGATYNLEEIKTRLDAEFFGDQFQSVQIGWSLQKARTRLGHYDFNSNHIILSKILDHPDIPFYVLESVVYHEMLHHIHRPVNGRIHTIHRPVNGRIHTSKFKSAEKLFPHYQASKAWFDKEYALFLRRACR